MGQTFPFGVAGGGAKVYTKANCTVNMTTKVLTFPTGVTWGAIKNFIFTGRRTDGTQSYAGYLYKSSPTATNATYSNGYTNSNESIAMTSDATSIPLNQYTIQNDGTWEILIVV